MANLAARRISDSTKRWGARATVFVAVAVCGGAGALNAAGAASNGVDYVTAADQVPVPAVTGPTGLKPAEKLPPLEGDNPAEVVNGLAIVPKLTTATMNVYARADGSQVAQVFAEPVNYRASDGQWAPIDPTLRQTKDAGWANASAEFSLAFPSTWTDSSPVTLAFNGTTIGETLDGQSPVVGKQLSDQAVLYANVLQATDAELDSTNEGSEETLVLRDKSAPATISETVTTSAGAVLALGDNGEIVIDDARGEQIGAIPAPTVTSAAIDPATGAPDLGPVTRKLSGGNGTYQISTSIDPAWLAQASYPVRLDPVVTTPNDSADTYVDDGSPTTSYWTDHSLYVKALSGGNAEHAFVNFDVGALFNSGRVVESAEIQLWDISQSAAATTVNLRRLTSGFNSSTNWNTQPSMAATVYSSPTATAGNWIRFPATSLYQQVFSTGTNFGVGFVVSSSGSSNQVRFASKEGGALTSPNSIPVLTLEYDDPPSKPTLQAPNPMGETIAYDSPTLAVTGPATDAQAGDTVQTEYQVSQSASFSPTVYDVTVGNGDSATVPSGILDDGQTYYWRAASFDGEEHTYSCTSACANTFTVSVPHLGDDERSSMWKDALGNSMDLKVNQATGNALLAYPLTTLDSPAGALSLQLVYNSLDGSGDHGEGRGWVLSTGTSVDPLKQPTGLGATAGLEALLVRTADGGQIAFTDADPASTSSQIHAWTAGGEGAGTITESNDGTNPVTYTYEPNDGGRYVFDSNGHLLLANPQTSDDGHVGFNYVYDPTSHLLTEVDDPQGAKVLVSYGGGSTPATDVSAVALQTSTGTRTWALGWGSTSNEVNSATDPNGNVVSFTYTSESDGDYYLTGVQDAGGTADKWHIGYTASTFAGAAAPMMQVTAVTDPGTYNVAAGGTAAIPPTTFSYGPQLTGSIASYSITSDPDGNATKTYFDTLGLPVVVQYPSETVGSTSGFVPVKTTLWDTNGNLMCERGPAANAYSLATLGYVRCTATHHAPDALQTDFTYQTASPFALVSKSPPVQFPTGSGSGPVTTYAYDQGIQGLLQENYQLPVPSGVPAHRAVAGSSPLNGNWSAGPPVGLSDSSDWSIRFTGRLAIATQKTYNFRVYATGGVRVIVSGHVLVDCLGVNHTSSYNCGSGSNRAIQLWPSNPRIIVEYHRFTGNSGSLDVQWDSSGSFADIPASGFNPDLNLLTSATKPSGLTTTYDYSGAAARQLPTTITTSDGSTSREEDRSYDGWGRRTDDTVAAGTAHAEHSQTFYDATKPCVSETVDGAGDETDYTCNGFGDITRQVVKVPAVTSPATQQVAADQQTDNTYDSLGQLLTSTRLGQAAATITSYTPTNQISRVTDPLGHRTDTTYTPAGDIATNVRDATGALPETLTYGYDATGNRISVTKAWNGTSATWGTSYDNQDRVSATLAPGAGRLPTTYTYDQPATLMTDAGFLTTSIKDPTGVQTTVTDNLRGQVVYTQVGTQSGATPRSPSVNGYDLSDRLTSTVDPNGSTTTSTYDAWDEQATVTTPTGPTSPTSMSGAAETTSMTYFRTGALDTSTDPSGQVTTYSIDGANRITQVAAPGPTPSSTVDWNYVYDNAGQTVEMVEPNGNVFDFRYNGLGQLGYSYEYPSGTANPAKQTTLTYDDDDQLISSTPAGSGAAVDCYLYDAFGDRTARFTVPSGSSCSSGTQSDKESFTYSPISGLTGAVEGGSGAAVAIAYRTDDPTLVDTVSEGSGVSTSYSYTAASERLSSVTHTRGASSSTVGYGYDASTGWINAVSDPFSAGSTSYGYNNDGQVTSMSDPAGLTTSYGYDSANRLITQSSAPTAGGAAVLSFGVSYNLLGRETALTQAFPAVSGAGGNATGAWAYTYAPGGELTSSTYTPSGGSAQPTTSYGYDGAGNRTSVQVGSGSPTVTSYDQADRPATVGGTAYTWDDQNRLRAVGSSRSYQYDAWGRMTSATVGSTTATYLYDALGRAQSSTTSGVTTGFIYDGISQDPVTETVGSGTPIDYTQTEMGVLGQEQALAGRGRGWPAPTPPAWPGRRPVRSPRRTARR